MSCCIYNCTWHHRKIPKRSFFQIPKNDAAKYWKLTKVRMFEDMSKEEFLEEGYKTLRVCDHHFLPDDINRYEGRRKPTLRPMAKPYFNPPVCTVCM
jgi:hypothetical protein